MTRSRPQSRLAALGGLAVLVTALVPALATQAAAEENLVRNPGVENVDNGAADCWEDVGWGDNRYSAGLSSQAHGGSNALRVSLTERTSGDRKFLQRQNATCAPKVTAGHQYDLSVWYMTTTPNTVVTAFRHDVEKGWQYWTDLATLPVSDTYRAAVVRTPAVPAGTDHIAWGVAIYGPGELVTDDYSTTEVRKDRKKPQPCSAEQGCAQGSWEVASYRAPVRGIHSVLLHTGKVLLIAGSGNDPSAFAAGSFSTTVYDPATHEFTPVDTPEDLFCAGHTQLPDGRVLVMGGNGAYPTEDGSRGYTGLRSSYVFDPKTNAYQRVNNLNDGHWYPSATALGNGDVLSLGGLNERGDGSVTVEHYSHEQGRWLGTGEIRQNWKFWGLYPAMILMQDGRLFYTGSHVFGNGLPGTGASIYDHRSGEVHDVPGLQDKDNRDQSMSVLLPPAQDQRVLTLGGGNIYSNVDANRHTDIIDLKQANPRYEPGPRIPLGHNADGSPQQDHQGKMYISAVLLPDGKVFETGGALHNRADEVFEASMFDPLTNTFTPGMATDPVPRGYHSSAFLLPDGRVMAVGNNPGDGSFDQRLSFYSPPYLFQGPRPRITELASQEWRYGSTQHITVDQQVSRAALIRPAAVTHSSDPNQRYVALPMTVRGNEIDLNVTSNPNLAPPGWYMLFVTNDKGVPSVAKWVHLT
ncbi:hypothetical protein GCM10012275_29750 [Longimycelium tulufanense]|uniref:Galactose oxidase n=1 Tax=Longimycelium tulufanense TaxID=907463 RepID=A0A8J3C8T8_9PSEU|nr:galactose oxidase early set domain-containing protein [Longimycelium tulufanense]GGM56645.1 hypothetical protein GCM10012275_29750 [Longimycelium tulufanense]